ILFSSKAPCTLVRIARTFAVPREPITRTVSPVAGSLRFSFSRSRLCFVQRAPHFLPLLFDLLDPGSHRIYKSLSRIRLSKSKKGVIFHLFENAAVRVKPTGDECFHFCVGLNFGGFLVQPSFALLKETPKITD